MDINKIIVVLYQPYKNNNSSVSFQNKSVYVAVGIREVT